MRLAAGLALALQCTLPLGLFGLFLARCPAKVPVALMIATLPAILETDSLKNHEATTLLGNFTIAAGR
jgi:hypothetical protein